MRLASLITLGCAANALGHRRKSLGFGPAHPGPVFRAGPRTNAFLPNADPLLVADRFVKDILGTRLTESMSFRIRDDSYTDSNTGVTHVYVRQVVNGLEVANGDMNINIKDGTVLSYGSSPLDASSHATQFYDGHVPMYVGHEDPSLMTDPHRDYCEILSSHLDSHRVGSQETLTDHHSPELHDLSHIHYSNCRHHDLPASQADIADFRHALLQFMVAATPNDDVVEDILANFDKHLNDMLIEAPTGHFAPTSPSANVLVSNVPDTVNPVKARLAYIQVFAQENWEGRNAYKDNYRPDGGKHKVFDYQYSPKETDSDAALAEAKKYINNTITQLFYTTNMVHDLYYRYGFDEVAGNFQQYNFGRGGAEHDAVIANAQDGSGYNNANFMTPPDGQNGRMRMYLWDTALPYRDGDLEAGIVIHELSHGLSTRLTGGPANSGCLGWGESGGMGEGWGDFLATTIRSTRVYRDYAMGAWAANQDRGIRNYVYSMNTTTNPSTYKTLDKPGYWGVHAIGEVWAEILWVVSQGLIAKHGFTDDLFPPPPGADDSAFYRAPTAPGAPRVPRHGNSLSVQLVLNGMKLQPCRPSFFDARDAIIEADAVLTGGENRCALWAGFAARGLGPDARVEGRTPWGGGVRFNVSLRWHLGLSADADGV
ncbi:hypothetical protein C0993_005260 [Termitomyces sp. T159_Od127]|nr:hypothetical protein C0993_005260 [Termitomyces sp. T159_Od127]